jgi:hypothetical protein
MEERRRTSNNAIRVCEKHRITLQTIDLKTQIGTKKEQTRNDEGNRKWKRKRITKTANEYSKITIKKELKYKNEKQNVTEK